jgi:hypothetical protein
MRTLQLMVSVSALLLMCGCSTKQSRPEQQSILEVVNSADTTRDTTSVPQGCRVGEVSYCLSSPGGTRECTCVDAQQIYRATGGLFAH